MTPPLAEPELIFVYGTLMRGFSLHRLLDRRARFVGTGTVEGRLVSLGDYPGLASGPGGKVHGEIYQAVNPRELLPLLDDAEGYDPRNADASLFVRETAEVSMADGSRASAWMYRYNGPLDDAEPVPSGDYRVHRGTPGLQTTS